MVIILVFVGVYIAVAVLPVIFNQFCHDMKQKEAARVSSRRVV